jgi:undecaprenyl-diphosphatase
MDSKMGSNLAWFLVIVGTAVAILAAEALTRRLLPAPESRRRGRAALAVGGAVLGVLVVLCLLLRIEGYTAADAHIVKLLSETRSAGLVDAFTIITTMGDVVPCLMIATALGVVLYLASGDRVLPLLLPVVVLVEVALQFLFDKVFADPTVNAVRSDLVVGGAGPIPSGSTARLFAIFLVAGLLWAPYSTRAQSRLVATGSLVLLVEVVSRLFLGRHFVTDIVGGLLLGVLLVVGCGWLLHALTARATAVERPHAESHDVVAV